MKNYSLYEKAEYMYENENFEKALQLFRNIQDADNYYDVQNYIGCCLLRLGQYTQAKEIFETICIFQPDWSRPVYNLGQTYMLLNEYEKALECFNNAIYINSSDADAYYYRGVYFQKIEDYNNAIINYNSSIALKPKEFEPHIGLCLCYDCLGDKEKALTEAKIAFELFDSDDTLYNYTLILNKLKKYDFSYNLLQQHNVILSDDVGLLKNLMFCAKKLKNNQICLDCAKKILSLYPNDIFAERIITENRKTDL